LPTAIFIFALTIFPLIYSVYISFQDYMMQTRTMTFIGLKNFADILADPRFFQSLWTTFKIGVPALVLEILIGFGLALLLSSISKGRGLLTSLLATPVMIAPAAAGMSFKMLYTPEWGPINHILGLPFGRSLEIDWLGNTALAPISVMLADVWQMAPFIMLILLAGLLGISEELYEAAHIDGASSWDTFRHITLPLIRLPLGIAAILRAIDLFKLFDLPYVMAHGGPASATETISLYAYLVGIQFLRVGYGAAMALLVLVLIILMSRLLVRFVRQEVEL
jgi:multiple sugar transport system permease protein